MASRGLWHFMSARTRRSLALSWSALFVLSLLLQYFSFALASPALAVHDEGLFELDGDTIANNATAPIGPADDWDSHPGATGNRFLFNNDPLSQQTDDIFTGGSTKDDLNTSGWNWTTGSVPDKDNIEHAFAASYEKNGHTFVYFGLDRYANNGDAFTGFWFFRGGVGPVAGGTFSGPHQVGDLLVLANFTNGGATASIQLLEWVGTGGEINGTLHELGSTTQECTNAPAADIACAVTNLSSINPSWNFDDKGTAGTNNPIPSDSFFEGGIDLDKLFGGTAPCFGSFLAETRASQSVDAVLKDFSGGAFNTCTPPTIETTSSAATADFGATVHDTASLSGNDGNASGTVKFFICGPNASKPDCSTGGTQVGGTVTVNTAPNPDTATSADFTVGTTAAASGWYCWRAEYTPDANSQYLAGKHTDTDTECFFVAPATIEISKVANPVGPVSAGSDIGFDITVHNNGTQTTLGISVSDNLPAGIVWTADPASNGASCSIDTAPSPDVLHCTKASLAADASFTVHIHGTTDAADCGTVSNTASVSTTNDGTDNDSASVVVQCPDIKVTKTPDGASVDAGGTITWSIKVENIGAGTATGVTATDNLPAGIHWTEAENDCSIAGPDGSQVLSCTVGTLASGASKTYQVSGVTSKLNCGPVNNTASASATNEPSNVLGNNSDNGSVTVLCANVTIGKTADHATVSAGSQIGFTLTWGNSTGGQATGVAVTDNLPGTAGLHWTIESSTGTGSACAITGVDGSQVLTCTGFDIPGNTAVSGTVHIVSGTTSATCAVVSNTGNVTTTNDGSAQASASTTVQCPDVTVVKTPDQGTVNAGSNAVFTIVVSNSNAAGTGTATNVTLTDNLPAGYTWTLGGANAADCSINTVPNPDVLSCNFGDLAPGASRTITLTAPTSGANCAVIPNLTTVAATNEAAAQQGNNSDTGSIDVLCANIGIVKNANPVGPVSAGADIGFDIIVSNTGDGTATNVQVSDDLPAGIVWTADAATGTATASCSINTAPIPDVLTCTAASMAPGTSFTVHIHGTTDAADCGTVTNTASVTSGNDGGGQDDASVVVQCPDLGVVKTGNGPLSAGDTATFTIVLTNHGPGAASGVTLDDQLPTGTWTLGGADAGSCSINGSNLLHCNFGTVANGATRTITISKDTIAAECPNIHNDVTVAATNENTDTDQFANSDDADITVNCPAISLTKSPDQAVINAGDPIGFTIVVTNSGAGNATGVHVTDNLPAGITWTADAPTGTASASCSINTAPNPDVLTCDAAVMATGSSFSVHIHGVTTPVNCGPVDNSAAVTTGNDGGDQDSASVTVQCPDVSVVKSPDGGNVNAGDNATFTIVVSNASGPGTGTAYDVTLTDNLPAGYTWTLGGANAADCSIDTVPNPDVLSCNFGDLAPGASRTVTLTTKTTGSNCAPIPNLATVAASNEGQDVLGNNSDDASINIQCANIEISKVANPVGPVNAGDTVGFDITTTNTGDGIATGVVVTDPLPAGIDWTLGAITGDTTGVDCSIVGAVGSEVLTCTDASLASQGSFSVHVSGATDAADCGTIDNTASVTTGNDGSGEASASVDVLCPDIQVVKDAPNTPIPVGQDLVYTITTTNIGKGTAYDVVLTDTLPAGFAWTVDDTTDCSITAGVLTCDFGDLAAGASVKVTLTAPTSGDPQTGNIDCGESLVHQIPNVASASASNEGDDVLGNNSDDANITVLCSALQIQKSFTGNSNGTDPDLGVPSAKIGDTLHYTLHYTGAGPIADATITDVLPIGLQYVAGTALGNADFNDGTYNAGTRTITWVSKGALPDPASGDVTYDVKVLVTAPDQPQPLVNLATIVGHTPTGSELSDSDTASVAVLAPPLELTPPPTNTLTPETGTSNPGFALMLILLGVAGLALGIGFVTPAPQRVRRRNRLG